MISINFLMVVIEITQINFFIFLRKRKDLYYSFEYKGYSKVYIEQERNLFTSPKLNPCLKFLTP